MARSMMRVVAALLLLVALVGTIAPCYAEEPSLDPVAEYKDAELLRKERQSTRCPGDCGAFYGHGHCNADGKCSCREYWGGEDCSIPVNALIPNTRMVSGVQANMWQYWVTDMNGGTHGQTVTWTVSSTRGDCDLYVQADRTPTRTDYYKRDVGTSMYFSLDVTNNNAARWYAGIHGYASQCNYSITVSVTGGGHTSCPNDCHNRGQCNRGVCQCQGGWAGSDCSIQVYQMSLGRAVSDTAYAGVWRYYSVPVSFNVAHLSLNLTGSYSYYPEVYVKFGSLPNSTFYDYRTGHWSSNSLSMEVTAPSGSHMMYVGLLAYTRAYYTVLITEHNSCPNQCSNHGQCDTWANTCRCGSQFSGPSCEYMTSPLANAQPVQGYAAANNWNYFHFTANSLSAVTVSVDQTDNDPNDDCDLYVRANYYPTLTHYDYADNLYAPHMSITINQPQFTTWYVGVYGKKKCTFQVKQTLASSGCSGCTPPYGQCTSQNTCHCFSGWAGPTCRTQVTPLSVGQTASGAIGRNQWSYYSFNVTGSVATVSLLEVEPWAKGYYWLFVGLQQVPDLEHSDYSNRETNTNYHEIDLSISSPTMIYIGVYGSPFDLGGPTHPSAHYQLSVWQSPF